MHARSKARRNFPEVAPEHPSIYIKGRLGDADCREILDNVLKPLDDAK